MGRKRQMVLAAINVSMPVPHTPERYVEMFRLVHRQQHVAKLQGDWVGMIGTLKVIDDDGQYHIQGEFFKYLDLNATRDWYNTQKGKKAEPTDLAEINIPEHLKPHFQFLPFVFFSRGHRLVVVSRDGKESLPPRQVATILVRLFSDQEVVKKFGKIDVVIEPTIETVDAILGMEKLRTLEIDVKPPNADDFDAEEKALFADMNEQNAGEFRVVLSSDDANGLRPNKRTRILALIAKSNGSVTGRGGARGKTKTISTTKHPLLEKVDYEHGVETRSAVLLKKAREILGRLRGRK